MKGAIPLMGVGARNGAISTRDGENFQDGFEGWSSGEVLAAGATSINKLWTDVYTGGGSGIYIISASGRAQVMLQSPLASTQVSGLETHAGLVLTNKWFKDFDMTVDVNTVECLRQNFPVKNWERAWIMWRYYDAFHHYYFTMKNDGIEYGKKDNNLSVDAQLFLVTNGAIDIPLDSWYTVRIRMIGSFCNIWVSGNLLVSHGDTGVSGATGAMYQGSVGLYNEDAHVLFDNVIINSV